MKRIVLGIFVCMLLIPLGARPASAGPPQYDPIIHVVQWGENLTVIARRYGITVHVIMNANRIYNQNRIYAGQRIVIPTGAPAPGTPAPTSTTGQCFHTVGYGDTLSGIAYRYGVNMNSIIQMNNIVNAHRIYRGQRLAIPCAYQPAQPAQPQQPHYPQPHYLQPTPTPQPTYHPPASTGGHYYIVRRGDTLAKIAWRFRVRIWTIVRANGIANPNVIYVGQRLWIPTDTPAPAPVVMPTKPGCEHLRWPRPGARLSGVIEARGTAEIDNFWYYKLEYRHDGLDEWHYITGEEDTVVNGSLGTWDTRTVSDGTYIFRLVVVDRTGNYPPPCEIAVKVDNYR